VCELLSPQGYYYGLKPNGTVIQKRSDEQMRTEERLAQLENELADLRSRWPAHSVKPQMIEEMEKMEDEIEQLKRMLGTRLLPWLTSE